MIKRKWYNKDINSSLLGFGCMRFKTNDGKVDEVLAEELIDKAYKSGINYFDTAIVYLDGQSEPVLGKALKKYDRNSLYIATKFSIWDFKDISEVEDMIDNQLKNLQTDYIDFYLLHAMNKSRLEKLKEYNVLALLEKWKKEKKIRNIGFSFHDNYDVFHELIELYNWDFCQIQFNYMDKDIQQGLKGYQELVEKQIPIIVMEPLKGGRLAGFNSNVEKKLKDYNDDSMAKWAFRWVASHKGVMTLLSGMNEMSQLEENIEIFSNLQLMNDGEFKLIDEVSNDLNKLQVVGCTNCKYCLPCPFNVNIPQNFAIINEYNMYKNIGSTKWLYTNLINSGKDASKCMKCKKCVSKCPQSILIPDELLKVKNIIEDLYL